MATRPNRVQDKQNETEGTKVSAIPEDAIRPKDHLPAKADVSKSGGPETFEYDEETYTFVADVHEIMDDVDFLEMLTEGNLIGAMKTLIGVEAWFHFKAKYRPESGTFKVEPHVSGAFKVAMAALKAKNS